MRKTCIQRERKKRENCEEKKIKNQNYILDLINEFDTMVNKLNPKLNGSSLFF